MNDYNPDSIQVLSGIEHCRLRPSMYVVDTAKDGLHHLFREILDNSVDEAMVGFCTSIKVKLLADGEMRNALGLQGAELVKKEYNIQVMVDKTIDIYKKVLE